MEKAVVMQYLADNYVTGIGVTSAIVVISYIAFSSRLMFLARCEDMNIGVSAFIPIVNLIVWVKYKIRKFKNKPYGENDVIDI